MVDSLTNHAIIPLAEGVKHMAFEIGQKVFIRAGLSKKVTTTGKVRRISPTGKKITVLLNSGIVSAFYRNFDNTRYVNNPGAGSFGSMLNDYIDVPKDPPTT